ncbi:MAG: 3-dehydroquinate synthase [Candidatus Amulumruptor caecigallinarius]|nr:3-dehydroquinate synthase [Candidatus Amulumruptor caecigallinarius]
MSLTSPIYFSDSPWQKLDEIVSGLGADKVFVLTDSNCFRMLLPTAWRRDRKKFAGIMDVAPGEGSKTVETALRLWECLSDAGATRNSLLVNIGGGLITDLGGFVASTFKRGIRFVNVPTTLLAAADAAIGGKTGVNLKMLKNEIGVFSPASAVLISSVFFNTLPNVEKISGFAEIVKTAMITDEKIYRGLLADGSPFDDMLMARAAHFSATAKMEIVAADPRESGLRKILNFGHTAGHAYETLSHMRGIGMPHGMAVAHGIFAELKISIEECGLAESICNEYENKILRKYYRPLPFSRQDAEQLLNLMSHDKKNVSSTYINFTLLKSIGNPELGVNLEKSKVLEYFAEGVLRQ